MESILVFYVTHPTETHANHVMTELLNKKLIACGNIIPIKSAYFWEGSRCNEDEFVTILKSPLSLEQQVEEHIINIHSYEIPCIMRTEFRCNASYGRWILEQTTD